MTAGITLVKHSAARGRRDDVTVSWPPSPVPCPPLVATAARFHPMAGSALEEALIEGVAGSVGGVLGLAVTYPLLATSTRLHLDRSAAGAAVSHVRVTPIAHAHCVRGPVEACHRTRQPLTPACLDVHPLRRRQRSRLLMVKRCARAPAPCARGLFSPVPLRTAGCIVARGSVPHRAQPPAAAPSRHGPCAPPPCLHGRRGRPVRGHGHRVREPGNQQPAVLCPLRPSPRRLVARVSAAHQPGRCRRPAGGGDGRRTECAGHQPPVGPRHPPPGPPRRQWRGRGCWRRSPAAGGGPPGVRGGRHRSLLAGHGGQPGDGEQPRRPVCSV